MEQVIGATPIEKEKRGVYSAASIGGGILLGGPFVVGWLMGENYKELGKPVLARRAKIIGIISFVLLIFISSLVKSNIGLGAITYGISYALFQRYQSKEVAEYLKNGGKKRKWWPAICIIVTSFIYLILILGLIVTPLLKEKLEKIKANSASDQQIQTLLLQIATEAKNLKDSSGNYGGFCEKELDILHNFSEQHNKLGWGCQYNGDKYSVTIQRENGINNNSGGDNGEPKYFCIDDADGLNVVTSNTPADVKHPICDNSSSSLSNKSGADLISSSLNLSPVVTTDPPKSITNSSIELTGSWHSIPSDNGVAWWEYAGNKEMNNPIEGRDNPIIGATFPSGAPAIGINALTLKPETKYYYRICINTLKTGTVCGKTLSFITLK